MAPATTKTAGGTDGSGRMRDVIVVAIAMGFIGAPDRYRTRDHNLKHPDWGPR
jgi:hypothetical protein